MTFSGWKSDDERASVTARFWTYVAKTEDGCWTWRGSLATGGYGSFGVRYKTYRSNRFAWFIHSGEWPGDKCVLHRCDNRACVRPDHLFLGTRNDNMQDMIRKGRAIHPSGINLGESNPNAKMTAEQVRAFRSAKCSIRELSRQTGISRYTIAHAIKRRTWAHVE